MSSADTDRKILKSSLVYGAGNIGALLLNFFLVPLYTFFLTTEELGLFDIVASTIVFLCPLFFGHIELAVIRWLIAGNDEKEIKKVMTNSLLIVLAGTGLFTLVYLGLSQFLNYDLTLLLYGYLVSNFLYIILKQAIRAIYSSTHYVISELIFTATVLVSAILLVKQYGLNGIFAAYSIAFTVFLIYLAFLGIGRYIRLKYMNPAKIRELLTYSSPLIFNTFSMWLNTMSSKYFVLMFMALSYNGVYAVAFKIAYVIQIINRIIYFSLQDRMFVIYGKPNYEAEFKSIFARYSRVLFSILFLLISTQKFILSLIIDVEFRSAAEFVPILALGVTLMSLGSVLGIIYQCTKENQRASRTSVTAGLVIVVLGYFMIPSYGLLGASAAFFLGNFLLYLYRAVDTQKMVSVRLLGTEVFIMIGLGVLIMILSRGGLYLQVSGVVIAVVLGCLLNREFLRMMYNRLQGKISI